MYFRDGELGDQLKEMMVTLPYRLRERVVGEVYRDMIDNFPLLSSLRHPSHVVGFLAEKLQINYCRS